MNLRKVTWGARAFFYSLFTEIRMPSYIGRPIYIRNLKGIMMNSRVRIYPGLRVEVENGGSVFIDKNTSIGQNFHVVASGSILKIGMDVTISGNVLVTNCDHSYQDISRSVLEQPLIEMKTEIGEGCFIGYGAVIQAGTILGKHCVVGANAVVRGSYPDYSVITGVPGQSIKIYNADTKKWERKERE